MQGKSGPTPRSRAARLVVGVTCAAVMGATGAVASAADPPSCSSSTDAPYSMQVSALTGPLGVDITLAFAAAPGCAEVEELKKVQLTTFDGNGKLDDVHNLTDVAAPHGVANIRLGHIERERRIEADVLIQTGQPPRTYVVRGEMTSRLRPDLVVAAVHAPLQTLTTRPIDVQAEIAELNGDSAANATVTLLWGPTPLKTGSVTVTAGGRASVSFANVELTTPVPTELTVLVSGASPAETDETNNSRSATVDVTEHELARSRLLVDGLGGYGTQFNQHVFAPVTPAPPATLPDLEAKVKALEPHLVRIFYHVGQEADAANMASFIETVKLAQDAGATINITYQTATNARLQPELFMGRFATILDDLVKARGLTNIRWITLQNEPNLPGNQITTDQYNGLYRALHAELLARGLRTQIGLMGGDLVESSGLRDQRIWFQYMAHNMNDILDAYSVHIYWSYWDIPRMEFRLRDVHQIVSEELPAAARKPVFVTEFGVRGILNFPGKPAFQPGYWEDGTQMSRTNIEAFQMLWFNIVSAQLGFSGTVKWDAYWGKYAADYNAAWWLIGPAEEGWPLMPAYHALRLLMQTTERGWQVVGIDPWADDDWKLDAEGRPYDQPEKEIAAFAGPNGALTLLGLDSHGRALNAAVADTPAYSIGGLPPYTGFNFVSWNPAGNGENAITGTLTTNAAGVARFEVPLHAAFALTTVPVS